MNILSKVLLLLTLSTVVQADFPVEPVEAIISWTAPDSRENGDAMDPSEIAGYEVSDSCVSNVVQVTGLTYTVALTVPYDCTYTVTTVDTKGVRSVPSDSFHFELSVPKAPVVTGVVVN